MDGEVHTFDAIDPELLCIPDIEGMAKSLGFPSYTSMYWLEPLAQNLEFGLRELKGSTDVNELRDCVNLDSDRSKSNSHDSYESVENEAYKPPPEGYELSSDSDCEKRKKVMKNKGRTKTAMTPTKKGSPKNDGRKKIPTKPVNSADGLEKDDVQGAGSGQQASKKCPRKYAGKRKAKSRPNFGPRSSGSGPNSGPCSSGSQPKFDAGVG
ncbi:hypothetical protein PIB30_079134 [Stylosanthes scabra]|uniref:PB1-like domain-containing protein n=1 Tax=Stylosanthes scabra TaxID=79078 RepID=A0ABU6XT70_9FABA|nr:hypothetical protein [Stylosanthes scabra]